MKKLILIAAVLALACGCKVIDAPKGYLRVANPHPYLFKAVSPDGSAFTVTVRVNEGNNDLDACKKAANNLLTRGKGYKFVSEGKLTTGSGLPGWEMVFSASKVGLDYLYYLAVVRWDSNFWGRHLLYVIEAAGEKAYMEKDLRGIKKAAKSLRY